MCSASGDKSPRAEIYLPNSVTTGWGAPRRMRPLSACLCVVDGMTVMHNLARVGNTLPLSFSLSLSGIGCPITSILPFRAFLKALNSFIFFFFFLLLHPFLQMSHCTIVVFFTPRSLVPSALSPCSVGLVLWVQRRLRSSRLTTSRPLARINLSPLFLPR